MMKARVWLVHWVDGSLLKLIDSGYASQYLNMSNTYMKTRLYTRMEHRNIRNNEMQG